MKRTNNLLFAIAALFAVAVISVEAGSCRKRSRCGEARGEQTTNCRGGNCRKNPRDKRPATPVKYGAPTRRAAAASAVSRGGCRGGMCPRG